MRHPRARKPSAGLSEPPRGMSVWIGRAKEKHERPTILGEYVARNEQIDKDALRQLGIRLAK